MNPKRTLIIGIDGATFAIIHPLIAQGRLPTLARLIAEGAHGPLQSTIPAVSPVAWSTFMTGKNPGKHNIFDFFGRVPNSYDFRINSSLDRTSKPLWVILSDFGKQVNISGVTLTFPPDRVNGCMVSGLGVPVRSATTFTHPPELTAEINQLFDGYQIIPNAKATLDNPQERDRFLEEMLQLMAKREKMTLHLLTRYPWEFGMGFFIDTDGACHNFWKYTEAAYREKDPAGAAKYGEVINRVYEAVDRSVGKFLQEVGDDTNLILVSDHGFGPLHRIFAVNHWLASQGWLTFRPVSPVKEAIKFGRRVLNKLLGRKSPLRSDFAADRIDWSRTRAFFYGTVGNIFINLEFREPHGVVKADQYDALRREMAKRLAEVRDPATGETIVEQVHLRDEVFSRENIVRAPDLVVQFKRGYGVFTGAPGKGTPKDQIIFDAYAWNGDHEMDGIFIARGPDFRPGAVVEGARLMDVAPTVLYLMGVPLPKDMDGSVLESALDPKLLAARPIEYSATYLSAGGTAQRFRNQAEEDEMRDQLRRLGYLE